jgi:hypothetical protein
MPNTRNLTTRAHAAAVTCVLAVAGAAPVLADPLANCTGRSFTDAVTRLELRILAGDDGEALDLPLKLAVKFRQGAPQEYPLSREQDVWFKPDVRAFQITGIDLMPVSKPSHYWFSGPNDCSYEVRAKLCAAVFSFEAHRVTVASSEPPGVDLDFEILSMGDVFDQGCVSKAAWRLGRRGPQFQLRLKDASGRLIWRKPAPIDVATLRQGGTVRVTRTQVEGSIRDTDSEVELRAQNANVPQVDEITVSLARAQR